jgi:hypothetical protein
MRDRVRRGLILIAAVACAAGSLAPVTASAGTKCKTRPVLASVTSGDIGAAWTLNVDRAYGPRWSDLSLAQSKRNWTVTTGDPHQPSTLHVTYFFSAIPCRGA